MFKAKLPHGGANLALRKQKGYVYAQPATKRTQSRKSEMRTLNSNASGARRFLCHHIWAITRTVRKKTENFVLLGELLK